MDDDLARVLWWWTVPEIVAFAVLFVVLLDSVAGSGAFLADYSRRVRVVGMGVAALQVLLPCWVYLDLRRRNDGTGAVWFYVAAMPVVNVFGVLAYLQARGDG